MYAGREGGECVRAWAIAVPMPRFAPVMMAMKGVGVAELVIMRLGFVFLLLFLM